MPREDPLVKVRARIIGALKSLEPEHDWVTTEMVVKFLELRHQEQYTLSKIGNNLRILRGKLVVTDKIYRGVRLWKSTGLDYVPDPPVKMLISFPKTVHEGLAECAKRSNLSRNSFVVNMVQTGIRHIATHCNPVAEAPLNPPPSDTCTPESVEELPV